MQRRAVIASLCAALVGASGLAFSAPASEYQVKAVFLFNFSQFVAWPAAAFARGDSPIVICVLGRDPFGPDLDAVVSGERVGARSLVVHRYQDVQQVKDCHILFIERSQAPQLSQVVQALDRKSVV